MNEDKFRLIFNGVIKNAETQKLVAFLNETLGFSESEIRSFLTSTPRVLPVIAGEHEIISLLDSLEQYGCRISMEKMSKEHESPFPISKKNYNIIRRELEKSSRGGFNLTLFVVSFLTDKMETPIPSIMDGYDEKIEIFLNECISVIAINERSFIVIDFFSDKTNALQTQEQIDYACTRFFGEDTPFLRGFSVFPEHGNTVSELLDFADKNSEEVNTSESNSLSQGDLNDRLSLNIIKVDESAIEMYQQELMNARGKKFKWLSERDLEELWLGLSGLPIVRQKEFLFRLPLDSPLIPGLEDIINKKSKPDNEPDIGRRIDEILIRMRGLESDETYLSIKKEISEKLKKISSLPTLSAVAGKLVSIANDNDSTIEDLADVIKNDPSLTLTILKIVNSAFYGLQHKIEAIERAVIIVGREEVVSIALGIAASKAIDIIPVNGLYQPKTLWHHLMGTALICRFLYQKFEKDDEPGLFTAGLLHDFGKIFLVENFPDLYGKIHIDAAEYNIPLYELEEESFGMNHAVIGQALASNWKLPEALVQAAAFHHQPFFATDHSLLAATIGFADYLYHRACPSKEISQVVTPHSPCLTYGHWTIIKDVFPGIVQGDMDLLVEDVAKFIDENNQVFSILG